MTTVEKWSTQRNERYDRNDGKDQLKIEQINTCCTLSVRFDNSEEITNRNILES